MSSGILDQLDKLALTITTADDDLADIASTADLSTQIDGLGDLLSKEDFVEAAVVFSGLSSVVEKFLMNQAPPDRGPAAIELINDSVTFVREYIDGSLQPDEIGGLMNPILAAMKEKFDVAPQQQDVSAKTENTGSESAGAAGSEPAGAAGFDMAGSDKKQTAVSQSKAKKKELPQHTVLKLIDENDVEIFVGFLDESTDQVNRIEEYVMALEENPENMDIINSLFRVFHSLKGAAGFLGMESINFLCHDAESLLDEARKSRLKVNGEFIDVVLAVRDMLEKLLTAVDDFIRAGKDKLPNFEGGLEMHDLAPALEMIENLMITSDESVQEGEDEPPKIGQILLGKNMVSPEKLKEALDKKSKPLGEILVDMGAATKDNVDTALDEQRKKKVLKTAAVKVDTKKLNVLLELVGELVISQSIISQNDVLQSEENERLSKDIVEMAKITDSIQDHIMALRMVPLRQTFRKMNRLVRDLARKMDKRVNFVISGEETEIDKTIVEQLNDPLVHLLRNAVDHGLETTMDRVDAGKSPDGTVTLNAYQKGGKVIIEVKDDGRGLDVEKLREKGIKQGLLEKGREYSEEEISNIIFHPGLSTHEVATDISGRGVGMDVVRKNIEQLGGRTEIHSVKGKGSTFAVMLPLTMAIVDGMLVRVGQEKYIIPTVAISQSLPPKAEQMSSVVNKGEIINVRGELIPLIRLHDLFGIPNGSTDITKSLVIIVSTETERRGLMVDDLLGQQQVVIKNLDKRLSGIKGFSGSSILGDGLVGLILDVGGIFEMASE